MSAETLHAAAALMRERAGAATPGPWRGTADYGVVAPREAWDKGLGTQRIAGMGMPHRSERMAANAEHIASWHPAVALAVADWLDHEAKACGLNRSPFVNAAHTLAHDVARAYLGSDS